MLICTVMLTSCNAQGVNSVVEDSQKPQEKTGDSEVTDKGSDGAYQVNIKFEGGSGKAHVESPVTINVKDGVSYATLVWSSSNYDYVIAYDQKYLNENPGGNSTFTVPVKSLDEAFIFTADTTAMSKPHEIEYTITWLTDASSGNSPGSLSDSEDDESTGSAGEKDRNLFGVRSEGKELLVNGKAPSGKEELKYAQGFDIFRYDGATIIRIYGEGDFLLIPSGMSDPAVTDEDGNEVDITIIRKPLERTYPVSTSVMDLLRELDVLKKVRFSPLEADDWSIEEVRRIMDDGRMLYAGKYRAPDYEMLVGGGCDLAIENTMIYHDPGVMEKIEELGIPVMVETSSYEKDPLGRLEWIKVYGELYDRSKEAGEFFEKKVTALSKVIASPAKSRTVACFYVSATGMINVRVPGDYITQMIEMAGGSYVPGASDDITQTGMGTLNMQMEDFLAAAADADVLLYNKTIDDSVSSIDDLIGKSEIFEQFKAVNEKNVYALEGDFFQKTTSMTDLIEDLHDLLGGKDREYEFFTRLE